MFSAISVPDLEVCIRVLWYVVRFTITVSPTAEVTWQGLVFRLIVDTENTSIKTNLHKPV